MFKTKGEKREETHKQIEQLAAAGRFEEALRLCESELEKKPNARQFMEDEADILAKMGKYQEAEELYDALLRRDPKNNVYREKKALNFPAVFFSILRQIGLSQEKHTVNQQKN